MKEDPPSIWAGAHATNYEAANYGTGLAGLVMAKSHQVLEKPYNPDCYFARVLEVGAGSGIHLRYVRHHFEEYWLTDANVGMLDQAKAAHAQQDRIRTRAVDARRLEFQDATFDRLIATHVLEHLYRPHEVLREWARVVSPGGIMSLVLPCDPGLLWRLGRNFGPRRRAKANGLAAYDYVMAREHVNAITNLVAFIHYYFDVYSEVWWPTRIPLSDINLVYAVNVRL